MSVFICPVCLGALEAGEKAYICPNGHSFDRAKEGYVHLLPANRMHSKAPGDDKNMVAARNRFLSAGYYSPLRKALCALFVKYAPERVQILDSGCGEGWYTLGIAEALESAGKAPSAAGIDISKSAVRLAVKRLKAGEFAVASAYRLPVADGSVDELLNCFSPLCEEEFLRVLKKGGKFFYVVPAPKHLWELKCAVYDEPYENERVEPDYAGFAHVETVSVSSRIFLPDVQTIEDLFTMTPYFWKTPESGLARLRELSSLETEASFDVHVYEKL